MSDEEMFEAICREIVNAVSLTSLEEAENNRKLKSKTHRLLRMIRSSIATKRALECQKEEVRI